MTPPKGCGFRVVRFAQCKLSAKGDRDKGTLCFQGVITAIAPLAGYFLPCGQSRYCPYRQSLPEV
jgi:hypothetical protein